MKLTPELLAQATSQLNPLKERQLDLRGQINSACSYEPLTQSQQASKSPRSKILVLPEYVCSSEIISK